MIWAGIILILVAIFMIAVMVGAIVDNKKRQIHATEKEEAFRVFLEDESFHVDKEMSYARNKLFVDSENRRWAIATSMFQKIYNFSDLIGYEMIEDGNSITKGGMGGAIVGGALFGVTGAVIGSNASKQSKPTCSRLQLRVQVNCLENPEHVLEFISTDTMKSSYNYINAFSKAKEMAATLQYIQAQITNGHTDNSKVTVEPSDTKTCPMCAETIKRKAVVCRFCGHKFEEASS